MNTRANIDVFRMEVNRDAVTKDVYVYEDHRTLLNVLYNARVTNAVAGPVNLVYFDYHADDRNPDPVHAQVRQNYRQQLPNRRDFWSFVEWDVGGDDGDWLKNGMELGLIQDALLIGAGDDGNLAPGVNTYQDHVGQQHRIFNMDHLWGGLNGGWLVNLGAGNQFQPLWDLLGWISTNGVCHFTDQRAAVPPLVLDFDLDYFTVRDTVGHVTWPDYRIFELFSNRYTHHLPPPAYRAIDFLQQLSPLVSFITIARESRYCGGYKGSGYLLEQLDHLLFNGRLCTRT